MSQLVWGVSELSGLTASGSTAVPVECGTPCRNPIETSSVGMRATLLSNGCKLCYRLHHQPSSVPTTDSRVVHMYDVQKIVPNGT